jgi:hypothetical protein
VSARPLCRTCKAKRHQGEPHLDGCDRAPVLTGGFAVCPCGARLDWTGDLDEEGRQWFEDWDVMHEACAVTS